MNEKAIQTKKLALISIFSALAVAIAPFAWFDFLGTKANPTQHAVNALLGVLVGPFWAAIAAIIIGVVRNGLGIGTVYAFPGGIPGGIVVGAVYWLFKRLKLGEKTRLTSAITEPIGTVLIGATLSLYLIAPWIQTAKILELLSKEGILLAYLTFGVGWTISSVSGSILGFSVLLILNRMGISRETLFGEG
jgi:energy coupling factor transporter S component ThiW